MYDETLQMLKDQLNESHKQVNLDVQITFLITDFNYDFYF